MSWRRKWPNLIQEDQLYKNMHSICSMEVVKILLEEVTGSRWFPDNEALVQLTERHSQQAVEQQERDGENVNLAPNDIIENVRERKETDEPEQNIRRQV